MAERIDEALFRDLAACLGRLGLAAIFVIEGYKKIFSYNAIAAAMSSAGLPGAVLPLVIALEFGGGLLVAIGWKTRIVALALAAFCIAAGLIFHGNIANHDHLQHLEKNFAIAGGFLFLWLYGPGNLSLTGWLAKRAARRAV